MKVMRINFFFIFCLNFATSSEIPEYPSYSIEETDFINEEKRDDDSGPMVDTSNPQVQDIIVKKHNSLRKLPKASNMLKMEWNAEAAEKAQYLANNCHFDHDSAEARATSQFGCGQNLALSPHLSSWNHITQMWYDEVKDFNYGRGSSGGPVGHYTQLVWATSFQVGCGYKKCESFHIYACNYCPSGNIIPYKYSPYRPGKRCSACPDDCDHGLCTNSCSYNDVYTNCKDLNDQHKVCQNPSFISYAKSCPATCKCEGKIY